MGLVARVIERAGIATAVYSWIPELTTSVGAPRVIGVEMPGSVAFGLPGDDSGQRSLLRSALEAAAAITEPGGRNDLSSAWPSERRLPRPPAPPPIVGAIKKKPWLYLKLLKGEIP